MNKTSSSTPDSQTSPYHHQAVAIVVQSPPLINDQDRDDQNQNDNHQKVGDEGLKCKVDEKGAAEDHNNSEKNSNNMCIIDVRNGEEEEERESGLSKDKEKVCRICQLGSDQLPAGLGNVNIVHLGCACKGDLGTSHYHCAKAWFMHRGNRICEICGKLAKNIEDVETTGLRALEAEINRALNAGEIPMNSTTYERNNRCAKSVCNFILAALVLAFLLPWVFHPSKLL